MIDLIAAQAAIEDESLNLGIARYRKDREKDETSTRPGKRLLVESVKPLAAALTDWIEGVTSGKPTAHANLAYFLADIDPIVVAYITARHVIMRMVARSSLQGCALRIAGQLEDAVNFDKLKQESPRGYNQLQRKIAHTSDQRYRHVVMRKQQKYAGVRTVKWGNKERLAIGLLLIDLMEQNVIINGAPLFKREFHSIGRGYSSTYQLVPTETAAKWLEESHARCEILEPMHLPMVVKPRPWTKPQNGGYLDPKMQYPLVKTKGRWAYLQELEHFEMPKVYTAVNALQDTAWRVNKGVLNVMREAWEASMQVAKLPPRDPLVLPPDAPADASETEIAARKAEKAQVHTDNAKLMSKRLSLAAKLWLAEKFSPYENIYFPHALDWRGRAYPVASYMHPQADDTGKALLEFADGVELGENGAYWLAVHGANCFGVDKVGFDERVQWVLDNEEGIISSAMDPLAHNALWITTDEAPWRFLSFCFEWAGYVVGGRSEEFKSHLPVAFDGSCNGLQNYSMMLRDEVGGAATNLVPNPKPSDIYAQVAAALEVIAARDAQANVPGAAAWVGKVTRKIAKQPTMTMPYGAGQFGYRQQIIDAMRKIEQDTGTPHLPGTETWVSAGYLAGVMREALAGVVVKAAQAMDWLQEASRIVSENGLPIRWESPAGLPVVQDYREMIGERIDTEITGQRIRLTVTKEGDKIDKRRQAQGIAPNFVHSLDASHMMETVCMGLDHGLTAFAMVHDSYATHAGRADTLNVLLREAFVALYRGDVLGRLRDELVAQLPPKLAAKVPPLPTLGTLDPEAVLASEYFFA